MGNVCRHGPLQLEVQASCKGNVRKTDYNDTHGDDGSRFFVHDGSSIITTTMRLLFGLPEDILIHISSLLEVQEILKLEQVDLPLNHVHRRS